jgi:uncharacterized protein (DUF305 family)
MTNMKEHYEKQFEMAQLERQEMSKRCRELEQFAERVKIESQRQVTHYKTKYSEYKTKMRKANQNIAVLTARLAKFDLELAAEKEDVNHGAGIIGNVNAPGGWVND